MRVTTTTLEKAVFRILKDHNLEPYDAVEFRELQAEWARTGLRQDDLRDALRQMFERDLLDFQNDGRGLSIIVTREGYEHATHGEMRLSTLVDDARDRYALYKASQRVRGNARAAGRRSQDQAASH